MLNKFSRKLTSFFIAKNCINENEKDIYLYSFEIFLATIINLFMIFSIGIIFNFVIETIIFSATFMMLRGKNGGMHAKNHLTCVISLITIFFILIAIVNFIDVSILKPLGFCMILVYLLISYKIAPIDCENKSIDVEQRRKLRKELRTVNIVLILIFSILFYIEQITYSFVMSYASFAVALLLFLGYVKKII